jgi:solute carrier family 25 phosphate transporter 3
VAYPRAEIDSYKSFRNPDDTLRVQKVEVALDRRGPSSTKVVSGVSSGSEPKLPFWSVGESSSQLLSLLPGGVGLEYDQNLKRYSLAVDNFWREQNPNYFTSNRPIDPEFGPRGRSPIEREMTLGVGAYLRFAASGSICCSTAHLLLTPIDVVKTKVQTNPVKYNGIISSFQTILKEEGASSFLNGWAPTFLGYFVWGAVGYTLTELARRSFQEMAGASASSYEVPIILAASGLAAAIGSVAIAPFEAVRIRSVAQPDYAPNIVQLFQRMVKEEGLLSLFSAVPVFLFKEIPFAMAKFTVFDLSTAWMYETFPAAREDIQLSLLVSLLGGTLGGVCAAVVSNPADATISEMKKAKTGLGPQEAVNVILQREGPTGMFKGLQLRFFIVSILVSIQFLLYDAVRISLGIGSDDLKLYLDVLGGALQEQGRPV